MVQSGQECQDVVRQILNTYILTIKNQQYENVPPQNEVQCWFCQTKSDMTIFNLLLI